MLTRPSTSSLFCCAQHQTSTVAAAPPGRHSSSLRANSEPTAKKLWWLLWMRKTFSLTETNLKLNLECLKIYLMNSTMTSYVNSFPGIQQWFHNILHSTEFTHEFMIMNSIMISLSLIHLHEFRDEFIYMNSNIWFHYVLHDHEFISEFILWIHIMNSDKISLSWIQDVTFHDLWIHIWIHVFEEYHEFIPEIMYTKVPDETSDSVLNSNQYSLWGILNMD